MKLVFATNNKHKLEEIKKIVPKDFHIINIKEIGCNDELPENGNTFEENALQKALYVFDKFCFNCFADDSGLEVEALGGRPGVYSARYAENSINGGSRDINNVRKLLAEMNHQENRKARFRTVIALVINNPSKVTFFFDGMVKGEIALEPTGANGFGYDPVFIPQGHQATFAEMTPEMKNTISHRGEAVKKLITFLMEL